MSKFLKFIVHFIVICTIVCVVGLAVPPFLGITTEIMDDSGKETNLPMGSVTYAIPVKIKEAAVGDSILYQTDSKAYRYMITEMDKKNHIFKVIDSSDKDAEPVAVEVKDYIPKVVITVGYAGYLLLATESIEGLIILGLAVLFLVILYIVAELLKKEPQDDYDDCQIQNPAYSFARVYTKGTAEIRCSFFSFQFRTDVLYLFLSNQKQTHAAQYKISPH